MSWGFQPLPAAGVSAAGGPVGSASVATPSARGVLAVAVLSLTVNLLTSTLAPAATANLPAGRGDGTTPPPAARSVWMLTSSTGQAEDADQAHRQTDWPLPPRAGARPDLTWTAGLPPGALSGAASPTIPQEWPLPRTRTAATRTEAQALLLTTLAQPVGATALARPEPRPAGLPPTWTQAPAVPEPVTVAPFALADWPLPLRDSTRLLLTSSTGQAEDADVAHKQHDWPLPVTGPDRRALLTATSALPPGVLAEVAPDPLRPQDWPQPRRVAAALPPVGDGSALVGVLARPVGASTLPPVPVRPALPPTWSQSPAVPDAAAVPVTPLGWPLPTLARPSPITSRWFACYYVVDDSAPFLSTADPLPRVARPTLPPTWSQGPAQTAPVAGTPLVSVDWPRPVRRPAPVDTHTPTNLLTLSTPPGTPFAQTAWPLPLPSAAQLLLTSSTGQAEDADVAHRQTDWPLPAPRPETRALLTATSALPPGSLAVVVDAPPVSGSWPLPVRAVVSQPPIWSQSPAQPTPTVVPVTPQEWPLPVRPRVASVTSLTFVFYYVVDDSVPFVSTTPENPRGRAAVITARTWTQSPAQPTAAAVPVTPIAWPLPVRAAVLAPPMWTQSPAPSAVPLVPSSWPLPKPRPARLVLDAPVSAIRFALATAPVGTAAQPIPLARPSLSVRDLTRTDGRKAYHVDLTPAHQTDWPLPLIPGAMPVRFTVALGALEYGALAFVSTERIVCVDAEDRVIDVPAEDRLARVGAEDRATAVPVEDRVCLVPVAGRVAAVPRDPLCEDEEE